MSEQASMSLEQERARLAQEHARLERMQRSLETERQLVKDTLGSELKRMEEESTVRKQEHEEFITEIGRERKALGEQRSALLQQEADLRRRQEAGRECEWVGECAELWFVLSDVQQAPEGSRSRRLPLCGSFQGHSGLAGEGGAGAGAAGGRPRSALKG
jgi:hypothetical protein